MVANMDHKQLKKIIETAWKKKEEINFQTSGEIRKAVNEILNLLDKGEKRVAEKINNIWIVHQWLKQAILLSFRLNENEMMGRKSFDKVPLKFKDWKKNDFENAGFRALPGSIVRHSAFIAKDVILMPSFINLGAYVNEGTMIDTWATVGSCAQIGKRVHLSGGAGIGGVLEPLQASPTIIEDGCFIGARSEIAEGVIIQEGAVISMGVYIGASTKIVERETGKIHMGTVPPYSVVVPGSIPGKKGAPSLYCAVIVKQVDEKTRSKTSINDLLRN